MIKKIIIIIIIVAFNRGYAQKEIIVGQDGTEKYSSVQEAINSIPKYNIKPVRISERMGAERL